MRMVFGSAGDPKCPRNRLVLQNNSINLLHIVILSYRTAKIIKDHPGSESQGQRLWPLCCHMSTCPLTKLFICLSVFPSVLLICEPVLVAGCGHRCGCVVAAERLLQQGSLGCSRQVEEGVEQRQQQQSQQQRDAPVRRHYGLFTASLQKRLVLHGEWTDHNTNGVARWKRKVSESNKIQVRRSEELFF